MYTTYVWQYMSNTSNKFESSLLVKISHYPIPESVLLSDYKGMKGRATLDWQTGRQNSRFVVDREYFSLVYGVL